MKKRCRGLAAVVLLWTVESTSADTMTDFSDDFSSYANGTEIQTESAWAGSGTYRAEWMVNNGKLYTSTSGHSKVYMTDTFDSGAIGYQVSARFSMDLAPNMTAGYADIVRIDLVAQENIHQNDVALFVRRDGAGQFRLIYRVEDHDTVIVQDSLGTFFLPSMGVDTIGSTDDLRIAMELRPISATEWHLTGTLSNLTEKTLIVSDAVTVDTSSDFLANDDLSGMLYVSCSDAEGGVSQRAVDKFRTSVIVPEVSLVVISSSL